jgi:hypothetical protein
MIKTKHAKSSTATERKALRQRIKQMYDAFNRESWDTCFSLLDPRLRDPSKVKLPVYAQQLQAFHKAYGQIKPWHVRLSLHLEERNSKAEHRPFAYVYVVWQDQAHGFHMFRERWVKHAGQWYTRVAGLIANRQETTRNQQG